MRRAPRPCSKGAAIAGDAEGQFNLGLVFLNGDGVAPNDEKAGFWLLQAAEAGHPGAQFNLALLYESGRGGDDNKPKAPGWMRMAAQAGLPEAMTAMGLMVHKGADGAGFTASDWFEKAAEAGDPQGQFFFAVALAEGDGRKKNRKAALSWVERALAGNGLPEKARHDALALKGALGAQG